MFTMLMDHSYTKGQGAMPMLVLFVVGGNSMCDKSMKEGLNLSSSKIENNTLCCTNHIEQSFMDVSLYHTWPCKLKLSKRGHHFVIYGLIRKKDHAMLNQVVHDIYSIYLFPYSRVRSELTKFTTIRDCHFDITMHPNQLRYAWFRVYTLNPKLLIHVCLGHDCHALASEDMDGPYTIKNGTWTGTSNDEILVRWIARFEWLESTLALTALVKNPKP